MKKRTSITLVKNTPYPSKDADGSNAVPANWTAASIQDLIVPGSLRAGPFGSDLKVSDFVSEGVRVFSQENVITNDFEKKPRYITLEKFQKMAAMEVREADFLVTARGTVGQFALVPELGMVRAILHPSLIKFTLDSSKICNEYANYHLKYAPYLRKQLAEKSTQTTIPALYTKDIATLSVTFPNSKAEQRLIASVLSKQDQVVKDCESFVRKLETRFRYFSKELLSGRLRVKDVYGKPVLYKNDEWKDVEVNGESVKIPQDWELQSLREIGELKTSSVDKKIRENESVVDLLNYMDVYSSASKQISAGIRFTKASVRAEKLDDLGIRRGDVFLTPSSETAEDIGHAAVAIENLPNAVYSYHLIRFRPSKKLINPEFSAHLLNAQYCRTYFSKNCQGSTRMTLTKSSFEDLQIYFPGSMEEQQGIAKVLNLLSTEIEHSTKQSAVESQKFSWLLENLMSGKYLLKEE